MGHGDDVSAFVPRRPAVDDRRHPFHQLGEALTPRRHEVRRCHPVFVRETAPMRGEFVPCQPLPRAEILFPEVGFDGPARCLMPRVGGRVDDRGRGLVGAPERAREPDGAGRQDAGERFEPRPLAGVRREVGLAVETTAMVHDRRVADPPPTGDDGASAHRSAARARRKRTSAICWAPPSTSPV